MSDDDEPGLRRRGAAEAELTLEGKAAVRRYLHHIFAYVGLLNAFVLFAGGAYIFGKVPTEVAHHAKALVLEDLSDLKSAFTKSSVDALSKAVAAQVQSESVVERGKRIDTLLADLQKTVDAVSGDKSQIALLVERIREAEAVVERGSKVDAQLADLQIKISSASGGDTGPIIGLSDRLNGFEKLMLERLKGFENLRASAGNPQLSALVYSIHSDLKQLTGRLDAKTPPLLTDGYGAKAHKHTLKLSQCPPGMIAVGLQVTYGGTCLARCDEDGGVIQDIKLYCR